MNRLGKYQIRRTLGQGAMGIVYEGFDPAIERTVAIKTILPSQVAGADFATLLARFKREAQAAGRLNHPGIVAIYDYGEELAQDISQEEATMMAPAGATHAASAQRVAYIAMEFVRGRELKEALLAQGERFPLPTIVNIMRQVLDALDHAHANGVVHRDIKPANLILLPDGHVKIADFGIARIEASELTQTGAVLGTPSYMSPEQFTGEPVDGRSDLFSCGVILYQMLTGERPFTGESTTTIMYKVLREEPPPPSQLNVALPPALDGVLRKALAKAPAQRFATGHEFAQALQDAVAQAQHPTAGVAQPAPAAAPGVAAPASRPRRTLAWTAAGAAAAVVVLAGGYVLFAQQRAASAPPQVASGVATPPAVSAPAPAPAPAAPAPAAAAAPLPGTVVISALGVADPQDPQFKGDATAVQRQALDAAHRQLIEKALALWLEPATMDRHRPLIERKLLANAGAFIRTVLQEGPADSGRSGLVEEQTRAVVSLRDLQRSLNDLSRDERIEFIRRQGDPRISIRIDVAGAAGPMTRERSQLAENVLKERIRSFGFRVRAADAENAAASAQPADFAIQGEVKLKQLSMRLPASGLTIAKAALTSWTLKAVQSATGEEVYVSTRLPTGKTWVDEDHALADIGKLVGEEFSRQFFLQNFVGRPQKATLLFTGLPEGTAPLMLRELRATRAVLDAQPQGEPARFELLLPEGNASDVIRDAIVRPLNAKLRVECLTMTGATANQLTIGYAASCGGADMRTRLESGAPAGLPAPPPRPATVPQRNTA